MKIAAYEVRPDEVPVIEGLCKKYGIELVSTGANLDATTVGMAEGADGVTTLGQSTYSNEVLDTLKGYGVQVLASRCVGYNHMNVEYARKLGFKLCNGAYAPNGVAEYTVMSILISIRKFKKALYNTDDNDFTLKGKMGRELRTMTVGVMGTGKIGFTVCKLLSSFGCKILAYDVYQNDAVKEYAEYVDLDTIYAESDVITIHTPLLPSTTGMINKEALSKMKDGVILIDNARGELVDIDAIIEGMETEKIGAMYMDAFPGETGIIHVPHNEDIVKTEGMPWFKLKYLRSFVNFVHTPHMAFFTEEAAEQMAECGVNSIYEVLTEGKSSHEIPQ
ncbi:MAG: lactate dehydrogenase [Clostridiales bacterium]|nr:lactate dehydrogenase [Candidatus Crickella caballi]